MKTKIYSSLVILFISIQFIAQNSIVALHSPTNGVQYFNNTNPVIAAYNAAIPGDTIYIPGGSFANPPVFAKKLTIYGAGYFPVATVATLPTKLTGNFTISGEADGLHLEGVELPNGLSFSTNEAVNNVLIKRNRIHSDLYVAQNNGIQASENNYFVENIIYNIPNINNLINSYFINNIIENRVMNPTQLTFLNNLFLYNYHDYYSEYATIHNASSCLFKNNIFLKDSDGQINISPSTSSTWSHNVFCVPSPNLGFSPVLVDNYYGVSRPDLLVNQTGDSFDFTHDYLLQPAAESIYLGDESTQVGLYGGISPFKDYSIPINPHITTATISNQSNASGLINVNIQVQAQTR
jgi:hypothetical protein